MDERWAVERALKSERELGALSERLRSATDTMAALARADVDINNKLDTGLRDMNAKLNRFEQSLEENRRRDEKAERERKEENQQRQRELIAELKSQVEEHKLVSRSVAARNRPFIAAMIGLGLLIQWLLENRPWELFR